MSHTNQEVGEYRLRIGTTILGIRTLPRLYETLLSEYFGRYCVRELAEFHLTIHIDSGDSAGRIPNSLYYDKEVTQKGFTFANRLIRGRRLPGDVGVELRVSRRLLCGRSIRIFEHLLHQAFYSANRIKDHDSFLVHSAGVVHEKSGYLFVGASRTGKTTVAKLSTNDRVLNDEICMVKLRGKSVRLHDTPFNGFFRGKVQGQAPLRAIFMLHPRAAHRIRPLGRSEAVSGLFQQIVPPVGLDELVGRRAYEQMLDAAGRLLERVPAYKLEFKQNNGFWRQIDRIMQKGDHS